MKTYYIDERTYQIHRGYPSKLLNYIQITEYKPGYRTIFVRVCECGIFRIKKLRIPLPYIIFIQNFANQGGAILPIGVLRVGCRGKPLDPDDLNNQEIYHLTFTHIDSLYRVCQAGNAISTFWNTSFDLSGSLDAWAKLTLEQVLEPEKFTFFRLQLHDLFYNRIS